MKKKAIKIAAASAVAASAFVAAAPLQSNAASNVTTTVDNAVKQMQVAYHTYSDVTANGKFADINAVYKELNAAKAAYASATALVKKAGGAQKDANLAKLDDNYNTYITKRVVTYVDAYNYAVKNLEANKVALKAAIDAKNLDNVQTSYNEISKQLKSRTVILDRVYGQTTRELLRSSYKADAQALRDTMQYDVTVAVKAKAVTEAITAGKLDVAKAAVDQINLYLPKVSETFKTDLTTKATAAVAAYEATQTPKVESVSAINGKQIEIKFNKAVTAATAENRANYSVQTNADTNPVGLATRDNTSSLSLSDDGKTLTITTTNSLNASLGNGGAIVTGTPFKFIVSGVQDSSGKTIEDYTVTVSSNDKVAPKLVSASATAKTTTTKVTLTFSEPVDTTGAIAYVGGVAATFQAGSTPNSVVLTTGQSLDAGKSYDITLLNLKDFNNNFIEGNPVNSSVTVSTDNVAPGAQEVKVVRDNLIEVTFDKAMDASTFAANSRVIDVNGVQQGGALVGSIKAGTGGKTVRLALSSTLPFNANGTFSGTLVLGNGIKDASGNTKDASNHAVSFTKDVAGPVVQSTSYVAPGAQYDGNTYVNGAVVVKFNEEVADTATQDFTLVTAGGAIVPGALNLGTEVASGSELIIPLTAGLTTGNYTLRAGNGVVTDLSSQSNTSVAGTVVVSVSSSSDTTRPVVTLTGTVAGTAAATSQATGTTIPVVMTDDVGLDLATVQNVNNYLLNGKPLPAGSWITVAHGVGSTEAAATNITVTINIPAKSVTASGAYTLNVTNVKDKAGNIATPNAVTNVGLVDDISPDLKTAVVSSNGLLVLGFTENVNTVAAGTINDFQFVINGTTVAIANNANIALFNAGNGTDTGKYVVTFNGLVDNGADNQAGTTSDNRLFLDVDNSGAYNAGDIILLTGTTTAPGPVASIDASLFSGLKVTVADDTTVADQSGIANPIKVGTTLTVK